MKIQTFNNGKGLTYGSDPRRIGCDIGGVLKTSKTDIIISPEAESVVPVLFNGSSGEHTATFTYVSRIVYDLGRDKGYKDNSLK